MQLLRLELIGDWATVQQAYEDNGATQQAKKAENNEHGRGQCPRQSVLNARRHLRQYDHLLQGPTQRNWRPSESVFKQSIQLSGKSGPYYESLWRTLI